ncbi:MAG TPA: lysine--tRNA ligase [Thermoanaerobaculia bacterium]
MSDPADSPPPAASSEHTLVENRRRNLEEIRRLAVDGDVYPFDFPVTASVSRIGSAHRDRPAEELEREAVSVSTAGRILARRVQGKAGFLDLSDGVDRVQVYVRRDVVGDAAWSLYGLLDLGDWIGVAGKIFKTRTGELTVKAESLKLLAKCLRPLPEKWHGLKDVERRYRQRYLDLVVNPESRRVFETRSRVVAYLRRFLDARGYLEVETPMMQPLPGGAIARPFKTHHNALDLELYLRIAPELYLKRLVVGGMPRVYELNRNFRNEGVGWRWNPEFTMLEFYEAYSRASDLMRLTEEMLSGLVTDVAGGATTPWQGRTLDWTAPYRRVTMREAVVEATRVDARGAIAAPDLDSAERLLAAARAYGVEKPERFAGQKGKLLAEVFEAVAEPLLQQPTFVHEFPTEISPLSKQDPTRPDWVDRFELYAGGMEVANGFSELNDPLEQAARFRKQAEARAGGDLEAAPYDDDYVEALEYGMPPAAGEGVGVDRLTMLLTDRHSIRDVILFPLLRPRAAGSGDEE